MNLLRSSIQTELDNFFRTFLNLCIPSRVVTNSAFCQARKKIKHSAFISLNEMAVDYFYSHFSTNRWHDFRLIAVDGSSIVVPKNEETIKKFKSHRTGKNGDPVVLVRISQAFDILNHITLTSKLSGYKISEIDLCVEHLKYLKAGDLCLLDRGYPSFWLFKYMLYKGIHFCARLTQQIWRTTINQVLKSNEKDKIIEIFPSLKSKKRCSEMGIDVASERLRILIIEKKESQIILITSLLDQNKHPYELFDDLYHNRWPVEESYKLWKRRLEIENFSGISVENIMQDFYANVLTMNLTSIIAFPVQEMIEEETKEHKLDYQINWTSALSKMKIFMVVLIFQHNSFKYIKILFHLFLKNILPRRPDRKFTRKPNYRKRFHIPYKPVI